MTVLVTGATSVIGVPLIKTLLNEKYSVYAIVRPNSSNIKKLDSFFPNQNLHIIELNLEDGEKLPECIPESIDVCVHLGWDGAGSENRKKRDVQQKNVLSSMKILKSCHRMSCKRFIFSGSQAEYGPCRSLIDERTSCQPVSEYGKAKIDFMNTAQSYLLEHTSLQPMQYVHTRIFSIYGPNDHKGSLIDSCVSAFLNHKSVELGKCEHLWNYLYIDDLVNAYMTLIKMKQFDKPFLVYNIASNHEETRPLKDFVQLVYETCEEQGEYILGAREENAEGAANLEPCINKIMQETGWIPQISFSDGIQKIVELRN